MIFDKVDNLSIYYPVIPQLEEAVRLIKSGEISLVKGGHETDTEGLHYNVAEYTTITGDKEYEIHRREIDVHVLFEGTEKILSAPRELEKEAGPYDEAGDASMVQGRENATSLMTPGYAAIYFPGEPHKPGIAVDGPAPLRKVIFKIAF